LTICEPRHEQQECHHGNLRIGPYLAFVSKFWAVEDVITRSRTASGYVDGAGLGVDPMQHFSTWARWIATAILAAIGTITTDVVVDFIKRQPETDDAIHAGMKFLLYLAQQPWLQIVGWIFVGLVAGLWLDLLLRKLDGSRANERKMLGAEMAKYGNYLGQFGSVPDSAKIKSYFHSARKFGIWAPDEVNINRAEKLIADYLKNVGTLLRDEHFRQAKQYAKASKARFQAR
jgi:hypothetical protein